MSVMSPSIGIGQMVVAINKGPHPLTIKYNKFKYVLEPNIERHIPYEAAQLWFGDPRTTTEIRMLALENGSTQMLYPRQHEVRRLRAKYGNLEGVGDETEIQNCPKVEVYTLEGERVYTVLEDPKGDHANPAVTTVAEQATTTTLIKQLQKQNDLLMEELNKRGGLDTVEPDADDSDVVNIQTGDLPTDEEE